MFVGDNFASTCTRKWFQITRTQVVFLHWMRDLNPWSLATPPTDWMPTDRPTKLLKIKLNACTPLWKSNRNFFSAQIFYHSFFVVCSGFYTWCMWGGQYQFCKFVLDFDHWLYISDILKKVTGSKPDIALVWFMQWEKMELEHGEKDWYWCIVRV